MLERKADEEGRMQGDEEDQTTGKNITAVNINGEGTPRKKARKARKQVQREQQGNKQEREAKKTAPSTSTGAAVSPAFSSPVGGGRQAQNSLHDKVHLRTTNICTLNNLQRLCACSYRRRNTMNLQ